MQRAKTAPSGGLALFAQAREQAQRALALVDSGPADDTLGPQVRQLIAGLDSEEKDRRFHQKGGSQEEAEPDPFESTATTSWDDIG